MYSDSESVRQTFAYPAQQLQQIKGGNSGKSLNRRPRDKKPPIKDQLYFKLKVLKHVGQLVSNLKNSIALFNHDLSERQLSYLQSSEGPCESESLLRQENPMVLFFECILWMLLWTILWKSSFQVVFSRIASSIEINFITVAIYCCYLLVYLNSKLRNQRQQLITVRSVIAKNYFKSRFPKLIPFIIATLIDAIFQSKEDTFLYYFTRIISFTLIPQISVLYKCLENAISSENKGEILIMFAKLLGKIILFLHLVSLLLNSTRNLQLRMGYDTNWVQQYRPLQTFQGRELYLLGWYWGSTILCTVGFGDIVPANNLERAVISFLEVFSALIFGYFVNYIGSLIKMQGEKTDIFEANLRKLNRYLSKTNIPGALKRQARAHFFDRQQIVKTYNQQQQQEILGNLNTNIKKDILQFRNLQVLKTSSISKIFNPDILKSIAFKMRKMIYAPEQTIFSPDKSSAQKLWLIEKGRVIERWYSGSGKEGKDVAIYTEDAQQNVLGWINFIKNQAYRLTAKSDTFSILHQIAREDFITIVKENRGNYLKLMENRDQMIITGRKYVYRCLCCQRLSHGTVDCPKIHLPKRSANFLFGKNISQNLFGRVGKRSRKQRVNLKMNWKIMFRANQFDPNESRQVEEIQPESAKNFTLSPRKSMIKKREKLKQRPSVDQVMEFVKKCSLKIIEKQEVNSNKRLSSKLDIISQYNSNKNLMPQPIPEDFNMQVFDRHLTDQVGYFQAGNYIKILQRLESKFEGKKKRSAL